MTEPSKPDTIKVKFSLFIGLEGCTREEIIEYLREDWESYTEEDKEEELRQFIGEHVNACYEEVEN